MHKLLKKRPGLLLLEVVVTILISSMAILGFGYFFVEATEQMRMSWQIRDGAEYGYYYVDQFRDKVRNGTNAKITHDTAPSSMDVEYIDRYDALETPHVYTFEYDTKLQMPVIKKDGVTLDYPNYPPPSASGRDEFLIDPKSFLIYEDDHKYPTGMDPRTYDINYRPFYLSLTFEMTYRRYPALQNRGVFEKVMDFSTGAYETNEKWVTIDTSGVVVNNPKIENW